MATTAPLSAQEEANEYDIEVLVFLNNEELSTELPRHGSDRHSSLDKEFRTIQGRIGDIGTQPVSEGQMSGVAANIIADPNYTVLQYTTWRQAVALIDDAQYVDISPLSIGDDDSGLKALVRFYHSPLLYLDVFLKYTPLRDIELDMEPSMELNLESETLDAEPVVPEFYFLKEKRRVKLTEVHYLDSPRLGVVLSVWPIEESDEEQEADTGISEEQAGQLIQVPEEQATPQ